MRSGQSSLLEHESLVKSGESQSTGSLLTTSIESEFFIFEVIIRDDKVTVIHLRDLKPKLMDKHKMDYMAKFICDRVGGHKSFYADFTGEIGKMDRVQRINSIDIFITEYAPAMMYDKEFVHRHLSQVGQKLIEDLRKTL